MIKKPLLACKFDPKKAVFPYLASPKIDGIRFVMVDGVALSRSFKPIRNKYVQQVLSKRLPNGIDGELTVGETFQETTSGIMSIEGEPEFTVWVFDYLKDDPNTPFYARMLELPKFVLPGHNYEILNGSPVNNFEELDFLEQKFLSLGYEGLMLRDPMGPYKFGRSTVNENILLKVKRFEDDEAVVIGIEEKMSNQNEPEKNELGYQRRSHSLAGMVGADTAGSLRVRNSAGQEFSIGSGLNDAQRAVIWNNPDYYIGKIAKYKYFPVGVKELPRHPIFLGWRDPEDM